MALARLHATAHGIYQLSLNGRGVGDVELAPGFTEYGARTQVQTYDVTDQVVHGSNVLGVVLADGWYRGQVGMLRSSEQFGDRTAFLAQLVVEHPDGSITVTGTDESWRSSVSHVRAADLIEGQVEDRRLAEQFWDPVVPRTSGGALVASPAPPMRGVEELRPVSVSRVNGHHVFDLGQNINGWVRLTDLGPSGTTLTLTHGEALGPDGDVTMEHLRPADIPFIERELTAGQVDRVTSAGAAGDVFEPRLTTHGFRYVRVEGHPGDLSEDDLTGIVVHTDLRRTGWFECSDDRVNALHDAAVWSFRGNACDIPTDCPTRERAGWTGDWQLFVPTATFLYDVAGFSTKWLRDLSVGQWDNGIVGNMAPMPPAEKVGMLEHVNGSAGWGDAAVLVPWEIYLEHGDLRLLEEQWPSMVAWLDFVERTAREQRHPSRVEARPEPAAHEQYLWDAGFHWGEWLVPGEDLSDFGAFSAADKSDVATAFFARSTAVASEVALLLGREQEAERYAAAQRRRHRCLAHRVHRRRRPAASADAGQPGAGARVRAGAGRPSRGHGGGAGHPGARERHSPGDRIPGDAGPAPGAQRRWPPRPRLRAALPGLAPVVDDDDRPRCDHGVGALGGHRRRRRAARVAEPLLQGRGGELPAPAPRRPAPYQPDVADLPRRAAPGRRHHLGQGRARLTPRQGRGLVATR